MRAPHNLAPTLDRDLTEQLTTLLEEAAASRQAQLDALPDSDTLVAAAHRTSVHRILDAIRAAQTMLEDGNYGICARCRVPVDPRTLRARPWTLSCSSCTWR